MSTFASSSEDQATSFSFHSNPLVRGAPPLHVSLAPPVLPSQSAHVAVLELPLCDLLFLSSSTVDEEDINTGNVTLYNLLIAYSSAPNNTNTDTDTDTDTDTRSGLQRCEVVVSYVDGSFGVFLSFATVDSATSFCRDLDTINVHSDENHSSMYKYFGLRDYKPAISQSPPSTFSSPAGRPSSPPSFSPPKQQRPSSPRSKTACPICFQQLEQQCTYRNICGHDFHLMCLVQWCSSTCPVCRLSLETFHDAGDEADDGLELDHDTSVPDISSSSFDQSLLCSPAQPSPSPSNSSHLTEHYAKSQCHSCRLERRMTFDSPDSKPAASPAPTSLSPLSPAPSTPKSSQQGLWLCLVCASLTCGDSKNPKGSGHTHQHFLETLHAYYQQVGGNRVYDFVGEGWVSRLISSEGGKIVAGMEGEDYRTEDLVEIEDMWGEKLEGMAGEFKRVLKDELDRGRKDVESRIAEMKLRYKAYEKEEMLPKDVLAALRKSEKLTKKRLKSTATALETTTKDLKFAEDLVESLEKTRGRWKDEVEKAGAELDRIRQTYSETVCPLEDKVEKLMLMLDGG
ncbi:hypothetical protein TrVE_jg9325 [Triparma verrucosa]|uniref:RING-type domain-containing protein n=1 Tax=Triparma verrucosa TaxID=1606542 RepID=A0A9W7KWV3_9STRA|nr:hypothetical protein TrVE_jg9325 [Triparma verrucosa]